MEIRTLEEEDAAAWWNLRLEALQTEPFAFGKSVEEHRATPVSVIASRFENPSPENFTLGAFEAGALVGMATFVRATGVKDKHKGHIYGVYVTAAHRGSGLGQALIAALLQKAQEDPSLEQILLAVGAPQTAAKKLYRKLGFQVYGVEPHALKIGSEYVDEDHMILLYRTKE